MSCLCRLINFLSKVSIVNTNVNDSMINIHYRGHILI
nr:MAG TPA: hypothetical protein [Caudoviricetes sp.]DAO37936.1 MAG TPA: hypothetical protein [Caudoviricetes sp.]